MSSFAANENSLLNCTSSFLALRYWAPEDGAKAKFSPLERIHILGGYFNNSYEEFISSFSGQVKYNIEDLLELLDEYHFLKFYIYRTESTSELEKLHELSYDIVANFFDLYEVLNLDKNDLMELIQNLFSRVSEDDQNFLGINKITLDDFCNDFDI